MTKPEIPQTPHQTAGALDAAEKLVTAWTQECPGVVAHSDDHYWVHVARPMLIAKIAEELGAGEKALGQLDIVLMTIELGEEADEYLAIDYGGTGWEQEPRISRARDQVATWQKQIAERAPCLLRSWQEGICRLLRRA